MPVDPSRKAKSLVSVLALCMMAVCLCIPLDALAGGSARDFCDANDRDVIVVRGNSRSRNVSRNRGRDRGRDIIVIDGNDRGRGRNSNRGNRGRGNRGRGKDGVRVFVR